MTWWTRKDPRLPDLTDSEDEEDDMKKPEEQEERPVYSGFKYKFIKYVCGVDRNKPTKKMTKEEKIALRIKISNISEDPKWKTYMNYNAVICAAAAVFLHAFWA